MENHMEVTKGSGALMDVNSTFKYTAGGNVQSVWRRYGWTPPSEYREDYLFKTNRESQGESSGLN
jgi:hypothetical protein